MKFPIDPRTYDLGCGDHGCKYVKPTGMATNGGCRCLFNKTHTLERFLLACIRVLNQKESEASND
jgi:hypothetical protein